jgi:STE24 endopeptidase
VSLQRLAVFLDRPGFPWKKLILGFSLGQYVLEGLLSLRQYKVLQKTKPPKTLEDEISQDVFDQSQVCAPTGCASRACSNLLLL